MQVSQKPTEKEIDECYEKLEENFKNHIESNSDIYFKNAIKASEMELFDDECYFEENDMLSYFGEFHNFQFWFINEINEEMKEKYPDFDLREHEAYYDAFDQIMINGDFPEIETETYKITGMISFDCDWWLMIEVK